MMIGPPRALKGGCSVTLARSQIIVMRNGDPDRRAGGNLIPAGLGITSIAASMSPDAFVIAGGPHIDTTYEWFPTKLPQSSGKIAGMSPLLTQIFLCRGGSASHCDPCQDPCWEGCQGTSLQDWWWQVIWLWGRRWRGRWRRVNSSIRPDSA